MWQPPSLLYCGGSDLEDGEGSTVRSRPAPREAKEEARTGREDEEEAHRHWCSRRTSGGGEDRGTS
jgi:hypothetical protein